MDIEKAKRLVLDPSVDRTHEIATGHGKTPRWLWIPLLLLIAGGLGYALRSQGSDSPGDATLPVASRPAPTAVQQTAASPATDEAIWTAAGYAEPAPPFPMTISPLISGRIVEFTPLEGERVAAGQTVARLDSALLERKRRERAAEADVKRASLRLAESTLARTRALEAIGSASKRELEQAESTLAVITAELEMIDTEIAGIDAEIALCTITAPSDGVILERLAMPGQWAGPDAAPAIATLYDPDRLQVWVDVNQRDAGRLLPGQKASISFDAAPGESFEGVVERIQPRASIAKNTVQAKISLPTAPPGLRPDMSVKVTFHPSTRKPRP